MNRLMRLVLAPLGMVGAILALSAAPAAAQAPPANPAETNVFEVEAKTLYCTRGGTNCVQPGGDVSRVRFADVTVFRFSPLPPSRDGDDDRSKQSKAVSGVPELVHAVCATHSVDPATGHLHARSIDFTAASIPIPGLPPGTINGNASVVNGDEQSRFAVGRMDVKASDQQGNKAEIEGLQVTNNRNDTRVFGGFEIQLKGTIMDFDVSNPAAPPTSVGPGTMSCRTNVTAVTAVTPPLSNFAAPPSFTSEVDDTGDLNDPS